MSIVSKIRRVAELPAAPKSTKLEDQLLTGVEVEREHEPTLKWLREFYAENEVWPTLDEFAEHISSDHTAEIKDYYTRLIAMEEEALGLADESSDTSEKPAAGPVVKDKEVTEGEGPAIATVSSRPFAAKKPVLSAGLFKQAGESRTEDAALQTLFAGMNEPIRIAYADIAASPDDLHKFNTPGFKLEDTEEEIPGGGELEEALQQVKEGEELSGVGSAMEQAAPTVEPAAPARTPGGLTIRPVSIPEVVPQNTVQLVEGQGTVTEFSNAENVERVVSGEDPVHVEKVISEVKAAFIVASVEGTTAAVRTDYLSSSESRPVKQSQAPRNRYEEKQSAQDDGPQETQMGRLTRKLQEFEQSPRNQPQPHSEEGHTHHGSHCKKAAKCPACDGTGKELVQFHRIMYVPCKECKGTGVVDPKQGEIDQAKFRDMGNQDTALSRIPAFQDQMRQRNAGRSCQKRASASSFQKAVEARLPAGGSVSFEDYAGSDYLELADISALTPGGGWGSKAMSIIVDEADKQGVSLMLLPVGDPGSPKHERLAKFYEQYGFEDAGDGAYHRVFRGRTASIKQTAGTLREMAISTLEKFFHGSESFEKNDFTKAREAYEDIAGGTPAGAADSQLHNFFYNKDASFPKAREAWDELKTLMNKQAKLNHSKKSTAAAVDSMVSQLTEKVAKYIDRITGVVTYTVKGDIYYDVVGEKDNRHHAEVVENIVATYDNEGTLVSVANDYPGSITKNLEEVPLFYFSSAENIEVLYDSKGDVQYSTGREKAVKTSGQVKKADLVQDKAIAALYWMLRGGRREEGVVSAGVSALKDKHGIDIWDTDLSVFRLLLKQWMADAGMSRKQANAAADELDIVLKTLGDNSIWDKATGSKKATRRALPAVRTASFLDIVPKYNVYADKVYHAVIHILQEEMHISEKDFSGMDAIIAEVEELFNQPETIAGCAAFEANGNRPQMCAEAIVATGTSNRGLMVPAVKASVANRGSWITPAGEIYNISDYNSLPNLPYDKAEHIDVAIANDWIPDALPQSDDNYELWRRKAVPKLIDKGYIRINTDSPQVFAVELSYDNSVITDQAWATLTDMLRDAVAAGKEVVIADTYGTNYSAKNKIELGGVLRELRAKREPVAAGKIPIVAKKTYTREEAIDYLTDSKNLAKYIKQTGMTGMLSTLSAEEFQEAVIEALKDLSMGSNAFSEQVDQLIDEDAEEVDAKEFPGIFERILDIYVFESEQLDDLYNIPAEFDIWRNITVTDVAAAVKELQETGKIADYKGVGTYWAADKDHAIAHWGGAGTQIIMHGKVPSSAIDWKRTVYARIHNYDEMELYIPEGTSIQLIEVWTPDGAVAINKTVTAAAQGVITNAAGKPMTFYHGTHAAFDQFQITGFGAHFGTKEQAQDRLESTAGDDEDARIIKVNLAIQNPYNIVSDLGDWEDMEMLEEYLAEANEGPFTNEEFAQFKTPADVRKGLQAKGYDGVVYENEFEGSGNSYIAFDPSQIKIKGKA